MGKIKIKFHFSFIIFALLLVLFGKLDILMCLIGSSILHEVGHFYIADKLGYTMSEITLMPYGASLNGEDIYVDYKHEILIAIAGPLVSLLICIVCVALWWIFPLMYNFTSTFVLCNFSLFLVNLLPIFPLDGGRILGGILKNKMPLFRAVKTLKIVGFIQVIILLGMYIASAFFQINFGLALFIIFLTISLLFSNKNEKYVLKGKVLSNKNFSKGVKVNIKAISDSANILELYKILEPNSLNYVIVIDKKNNTDFSINEQEIQNILTNYSLDTQLKDLKNKYLLKK